MDTKTYTDNAPYDSNDKDDFDPFNDGNVDLIDDDYTDFDEKTLWGTMTISCT